MSFDEIVAQVGATAGFVVRKYDGARRIGEVRVPQLDDAAQEADAEWRCSLRDGPHTARRVGRATPGQDGRTSGGTDARDELDRREQWRGKVTFALERGTASEAAVGLEVSFRTWSTDVFVMMPSGVYAANRFDAVRSEYPPLPCTFDVDPPITISDVPRLSNTQGPSRIQLRVGDLATPAVALWFPEQSRALIVLTGVQTPKGFVGYELEESDDRSGARLVIMAPAMREEVKYRICDLSYPSDDVAPQWGEGDRVSVDVEVVAFPCDSVMQLYAAYFAVRDDVVAPGPFEPMLPFSHALRLIEEKYNDGGNWDPDSEYYAVGLRESTTQDWQTGWVGGGMSPYPLFLDGEELSERRADRTFDFLTGAAQEESGLYCGFHHRGVFSQDLGQWLDRHLGRGGSVDDRLGKGLHEHSDGHLVRKSADALYFLARRIIADRYRPAGFPPTWVVSVRLCADALVSIFERYGQFGQYVGAKDLSIAVGGTTSAAIAPAALALCADVAREPRYLDVAVRSGVSLYERFVSQGFTNGGPGDMLQNPDSESAYALLASMVTLWESTGDGEWLGRARDVAHYCSTWTMNYDFPFPAESTFGRLGMRTTGSVFANVQNKHSAPGICTLSGRSLFKLFRATDDVRYLEMIRAIAHNITQYVSRDDRPIVAQDGRVMPSGWINERVETSDWLEPIGEVFYGSCWSEVACMLTYSDLPGVYVRTDRRQVYVLDNVRARVVGREPRSGNLRVRVDNPTPFPATVKVWCEAAEGARTPLGEAAFTEPRVIRLGAGDRAVFDARVMWPIAGYGRSDDGGDGDDWDEQRADGDGE